MSETKACEPAKLISLATPAEAERGLTETQNLLIAVNKLAPDSVRFVYETCARIINPEAA